MYSHVATNMLHHCHMHDELYAAQVKNLLSAEHLHTEKFSAITLYLGLNHTKLILCLTDPAGSLLPNLK